MKSELSELIQHSALHWIQKNTKSTVSVSCLTLSLYTLSCCLQKNDLLPPKALDQHLGFLVLSGHWKQGYQPPNPQPPLTKEMCSPAALKQKADPTAGTLSQNPWDEIGLRKSVHDVDIKGTNTFLHTQYRHTGVNMYIYIYPYSIKECICIYAVLEYALVFAHAWGRIFDCDARRLKLLKLLAPSVYTMLYSQSALHNGKVAPTLALLSGKHPGLKLPSPLLLMNPGYGMPTQLVYLEIKSIEGWLLEREGNPFRVCFQISASTGSLSRQQILQRSLLSKISWGKGLLSSWPVGQVTRS